MSQVWDDIQALFAQVADLPPAERAALLDARCAGRPDFRAEVDSLLASHDLADRFLTGSALAAAGEPRVEGFAGRIVGRFRLREKIGEGGMGVVYRAERADGEFREEVAVKLIPASLRQPDAARRFRVERQILATLNHPDIVTLLDGGVTDTGEAYLAMKYVDGVPITQYCRERGLGLIERIHLFQRVCGAVQCAHQNAIVHRDLKPANILVTPDGIPKVLDFGVAKLLDASGGAAESTATLLGPMTPNYASPEQLRGLPITTACDIYALGVLLYELLTGTRPYETGSKPLDEVLRTVTDQEPPRPSVARGPDALPYHLMALRGDLDAIVLKAMSKDPARRYASAQELSEDLARHLKHQPVIAREPSFAYALSTLARRHQSAFVAAAISLIALAAALGVSLWQTRLAVAERNRATARFNDARQLANALIFKIHDGVQPLPGSTSVRQMIVAEALTYLERLSSDPSADDTLRLELARGYHRIGTVQGVSNVPNLGDRAGARASVEKAVALLRPVASQPDAPREAIVELAEAHLTLSTIAQFGGTNEEVQSAADDGLRLAEALVRRFPQDVEARRLLGSAYFSKAFRATDEESLAAWQRAGDVFDSLLAEAPDDPDRQRNVARVQKYIGGHYQLTRDLDRALSHHLRARELDEKRVAAAPAHRQAQLDLAIDFGNIAWIHREAGRLQEAVAAYERSRDLRRRLSESDADDDYLRGRLAYSLAQLGVLYIETGKREDALIHAREAVRIAEARSSGGSGTPRELAEYLAQLGRVESSAGLRESGCGHIRRAAAMARDMRLNPVANDRMFLDYVRDAVASCN